MDADAKRERPGGGGVGSMRIPADNGGREGQKMAKSCERLLWMSPTIKCNAYTVRPLLSLDLVYPRFLRPKLSTPNL